MLVLTRALGTYISLEGGRIKIQLIQIKGKQVRLGIICDRAIDIARLDKDGQVEDIKPKTKDGNK